MLYPVFLMKVLCFALFACAFNLLIGYVGLLLVRPRRVLRHGQLHRRLDGEDLGPLGGTRDPCRRRRRRRRWAWCFGWLAIRRQGIYFAMITLALSQMVYFFCVEAPFTGGEDGIQQVPRSPLFGVIPMQADMALYWLVAGGLPAGFLLIHRIIHSPFGQVLKAIRENEPRAISLGYRADDYKLLAFVLSAALAGIAGATKAQVFGIATLTDVHWSMSGEVVLMTLLGGIGTIFGPVLGALVFGSAGDLSGAVRRLGDGDAGRDLRRLRAGVPPRHDRRAGGAAAASPCSTSVASGPARCSLPRRC